MSLNALLAAVATAIARQDGASANRSDPLSPSSAKIRSSDESAPRQRQTIIPSLPPLVRTIGFFSLSRPQPLALLSPPALQIPTPPPPPPHHTPPLTPSLGPSYRRLLDPRNPDTRAAVRDASGGGANPQWNPAPLVAAALGARAPAADEWRDAVSCRLASVAASLGSRRRDAFDALGEEVTPFLKLFRDDPDAWMVDPLIGLGRALRRAAVEADRAAAAPSASPSSAAGNGSSSSSSSSSKALEACGTHLQKCFAAAQQAAGGNKAKKLASLDLVVSLFRVYFALNTLRLCKNLIAAVGSRQFAPFEHFPASQRVTYKYFCGRLAIFDEAYAEADEHLSYCLSRCPAGAAGNRQRARAAFFLVPVRLLVFGSLPSAGLLSSSKEVSDAYAQLASAVRAGDLRSLDAVLDERRW